MKQENKLRLVIWLFAIALLTVVCVSTPGGDSAGDLITASLSEFSGRVQVLKASEGEFRPAEVDLSLEVNDQVLTGEDGRARIDLSNGTIIRISPLSNFVLTGIENTDEGILTRLQLNIGHLWVILRGGVVEVDTPAGLASVRGSYLQVSVDPLTEEVSITCLEGDCALGNSRGSVRLVAGQTAIIRGEGQPPEAGLMDHTQVAEWLDANPEATLVVIPLTATVQANEDKPLPQLETNTPTPTKTEGPTPTASATSTATKTLIAVDCGPPDGWVLHTVRTGETLLSLSKLYRVSEADLRKANCRGEMSFVVAGEKLFVPNVATSTPTKTPTPTPLKTSTPTSGSGGSGGSGGATATATNSPTTMSGPVGPDNETITTSSACPNPYKIKVLDPDGIQEVKLIYTFDGSLPMRDPAVSAGDYLLLPALSNDYYGVTDYVIDSTGKTTPVEIRFRFVAKDKLGNITYFPASDAYDLTDTVNCSEDSAAVFSNPDGPDGLTISTADNCEQTFQVDVVDADGLAVVKLLYNVEGVTPSWNTAVAAGDYYDLTGSGDTYSITTVIDSTWGTTTLVKYVFAAKDSKGNIYRYPATGYYSYIDDAECGKTVTASTTTPDGAVITDGLYCANDYKIDVADANGIAGVKLVYTITDGDGSPTSSPMNVTVPLDTPNTEGTGGLYVLSGYLVDTTGFTPAPSAITVNFEFLVRDDQGHESTEFTGSFSDTIGCVP